MGRQEDDLLQSLAVNLGEFLVFSPLLFGDLLQTIKARPQP